MWSRVWTFHPLVYVYVFCVVVADCCVYFQDTVRLATGCQDGLMRIYDTCHPEKMPEEFKVSSSSTDGISKIAWVTSEPGMVLVGKKSGVIEKWDTRGHNKEAVCSALVPGGETVMDFEINTTHNVIMVASGKKVSDSYPTYTSFWLTVVFVW